MQTIETLNLDLDSFSVAKVQTCDIDDVKKHIPMGNCSLNILLQNIRSICCNMPNFISLLQRSELNWDVLVLSECWLASSKHIPDLENYNYATTTSHKTQNEGVVIYYNKQLNIAIEEPEMADANCLLLKLSSDTCILGIYRPPSQFNTSNFVNSIDTLLSKLNSFKNIILCGDINIDIVPNSPDRRAYEYLNVLASHGMLPTHTLPTHGRTCLDHIIIKTKLEATCFVFETSITDHESVAISFGHGVKKACLNKACHRISFDKLDIAVNKINFQPILDCTDVNVATDSLIFQLNAAITENSQLIKTPNRKRTSKPWITKGLLKCMRNRDNLHKKMKKDPKNETLKTTYKRYRNFCNSLLKKAKRDYEKQEIVNARDNKKQLWEVIKKISGSNKTKDHSPSLLSSDDPVKSINNVNSFFANVGRNLAEQITCHTQFCRPMLNDPSIISPTHSLVLLSTDEKEIIQLIQGLRENCAVGADQISGKILKRYVNLLSLPITHICNLAITTGVFPRALKLAVIKPIHKGGKTDSTNNYRPISILPTISKILERLMNHRLIKYLESNNLLSSAQFGFRHGKSTNEAVHELVNAIMMGMDERKKCLTVFLDLAKAFDTVSIPNLLFKLEKIGVRGLPLKLFESYLDDRKQRVKIDCRLSDDLAVNYGVPQGSILGPTLFLVYINDLCLQQLDCGKIFSFADDTALFFSGDSWKDVFEIAQKGFSNVSTWLQRNVLTLNVSKTKYIAFAHKSNLLPPPNLAITAHACNTTTSNCFCPTLLRCESIKYLGIIIDQNLNFKLHIEVLAGRLRKLIYIFKTLKHVADRRVIKMVYFALGQSIIDYCITSWGGAAKTHMIEVERAQRAILKVGAGLPFRFPTVELLKKWDVLTVRQSFILHTVLKKHSQLEFDPGLIKEKRRKGKVCPSQSLHSKLSHNFFCFLGSFLYNKLNISLRIYSLHRYSCKLRVIKYLKTLSYVETESLLCPIT